MSDDLIARLRGDYGPPCTCFAYHPGECACDADWPTYHVAEAANEIERLQHLVDRLMTVLDRSVPLPPHSTKAADQ